MLKDITIGQYFPGNSFLHQLDPRMKILSLIFLITAVLCMYTISAYSLFMLFTFFIIWRSRLPFKMMAKSLKPLLWIIVFTMFIHLFMTPGIVVTQISFLTITQEGIQQAIIISLRLILLILLASILTFTTSPIALTDALENLLTPFKRFGVPAHELAMMMTIALRFIPTLLEEADRIMKAQEARGADFTTGSLKKRVQNMIPLLVPLFISAFRRADELSFAMEARCYRGGENRTRLHTLRFTSLDYVAAVILTIVILGIWSLQFVGEFIW